MEIVEIGNGGKLSYDRIGAMKLMYPFIVDSNKISTMFLYDLFEGKIVNASHVSHDSKEIMYEIEPNDHVAFELNCDVNECSLNLYEIKVHVELIDYNGYEQYETTGVNVSKVYSTNFDRHRFRSFSNDNDTPNILAFVLAYLVPFDLPYVYYHFLTTDEVVKEIKRFFES